MQDRGTSNHESANRVRTSSGMFLNREEDSIIEGIEARIAKYTAIPKENGEGLQVLHYQVFVHLLYK